MKIFNFLRKNRIYIPFPADAAIGGPITFMQNLKRYLDENGFKYACGPRFARGVFFPIAYNIEAIKKIKSKGGKVIQRLDGVYYPSQHGENYKVMNMEIEDIYSHYADFVVFQSEYSKRQGFAIMGEKKSHEFTVIHNGANKKIFYPANGHEKLTGKIRFVMTGSFRKPAMIEPVVLALDSLRGKLDFELMVVGQILNKEIEPFFQREYVKLFGPKNAEEVAGVLRTAHVFIHSQLNDNCPNAVLEALSCGLPIAGFDSGAMSELLFFQKDLLAYVSDDIFQKYEDFDWHKLADKIELAVVGFKKHKKTAMVNSHLYPFDECGKKYTEVFDKVLFEG